MIKKQIGLQNQSVQNQNIFIKSLFGLTALNRVWWKSSLLVSFICTRTWFCTS